METKTLVAIILTLIGFAVVVILLLFFKSNSSQTGVNNISNWSIWSPFG